MHLYPYLLGFPEEEFTLLFQNALPRRTIFGGLISWQSITTKNSIFQKPDLLQLNNNVQPLAFTPEKIIKHFEIHELLRPYLLKNIIISSGTFVKIFYFDK